jgi:hypothetical protein
MLLLPIMVPAMTGQDFWGATLLGGLVVLFVPLVDSCFVTNSDETCWSNV